MVSNHHRSIVLKMSAFSAGSLLGDLDYALKYLRAFHGLDSYEYISCLSFRNIVADCIHAYDGSQQVVVDVRLPHPSDERFVY